MRFGKRVADARQMLAQEFDGDAWDQLKGGKQWPGALEGAGEELGRRLDTRAAREYGRGLGRARKQLQQTPP